jgi:hypothetical protein
MFQVQVFWVVTQCSVMVGYHQFDATLRHNPENLGLNHESDLPEIARGFLETLYYAVVSSSLTNK